MFFSDLIKLIEGAGISSGFVVAVILALVIGVFSRTVWISGTISASAFCALAVELFLHSPWGITAIFVFPIFWVYVMNEAFKIRRKEKKKADKSE